MIKFRYPQSLFDINGDPKESADKFMARVSVDFATCGGVPRCGYIDEETADLVFTDEEIDAPNPPRA